MSYRCGRAARWSSTAVVALLANCAVLASAGGLIATGSAEAATLPTITLAITPTSVTVGGTLQSGGVNVVATDTGVKEAGALLVRLNPGVTAAEAISNLESKKKKDINEVGRYGSIVFDEEVEPGHPAEAQTTLQPGQYVALVTQQGPPKIHASFSVTAASAPATLPAPQAVLRAIEFGFLGPTTLHNGELVGVENEGFLVHMDIALQVKDLKTAKQLVKLLLAGKEKQANKLIRGGFALSGPVAHGAYQQETIHAKPGVYVQVCFM